LSKNLLVGSLEQIKNLLGEQIRSDQLTNDAIYAQMAVMGEVGDVDMRRS
jgi:hypothetical protein